MMFDNYCLRKILNGEKTVTRRVRRNNRRPAVPGKIHKLKIDRTEKTFGFIRIKSCEPESYPQISQKEAEKEGFECPEFYLTYFRYINNLEHHVIPTWRIEFEVVK